MSKPTIRRLVAYIIDAIIVALIASALSRVSFLNPRMEAYDKMEDEYTEILLEARNDPKKASELMSDEKVNDLTYELAYNGMYMNICTIVVTCLYFVVFQYYTKGATLGRKLLKIQLISRDGKDVSMLQLLKRSIIINSLLTGTILIIFISLMSKGAYIKYASYVQLFEYGLVFLSCGFVIYRDDGVGLHDLFAGTRVILASEKDKYLKSLNDNKVKEAVVVEENELEEDVVEPKNVVKKTTTKKKSTSKKTVKKDK